jgi:hypothetical protein
MNCSLYFTETENVLKSEKVTAQHLQFEVVQRNWREVCSDARHVFFSACISSHIFLFSFWCLLIVKRGLLMTSQYMHIIYFDHICNPSFLTTPHFYVPSKQSPLLCFHVFLFWLRRENVILVSIVNSTSIHFPASNILRYLVFFLVK